MSEVAAGGRDRAGVQEFIERFAGQLADAGMQRMAARVFVALLAEDAARLTAAELAEVLQVSPAAISGAVRYLTQVDMIERRREPGSRRDYYFLKADMWYDMITQREQLMLRWRSILDDGIDALGVHTRAGQRMRETVAFFDYLHEEMPGVMERWKERRAKLHREWGLSD
ncbi:MarR family transcriptional regulator [Actinocrispum sp. NPDC049592]|uniref:GbsR/MarR family transcriptional regulator n=1 Tax=Actinocrispum sp. NPDC049592 TaxID=3154835 RepID=UPI00342D9B8E